MRKFFLMFSLIGILCATGVCAEGNESLIALYTCPDGCSVTNDTATTKFDCVYPEGKTCGVPVINIFVPEMLEVFTNTASKPQTKTEFKKKSEPVAARAGVKPVGASQAVNKLTQSARGRLCPAGCHVYCEDPNTSSCQGCPMPPGCTCVDNKTGQACQMQIQQVER